MYHSPFLFDGDCCMAFSVKIFWIALRKYKSEKRVFSISFTVSSVRAASCSLEISNFSLGRYSKCLPQYNVAVSASLFLHAFYLIIEFCLPVFYNGKFFFVFCNSASTTFLLFVLFPRIFLPFFALVTVNKPAVKLWYRFAAGYATELMAVILFSSCFTWFSENCNFISASVGVNAVTANGKTSFSYQPFIHSRPSTVYILYSREQWGK